MTRAAHGNTQAVSTERMGTIAPQRTEPHSAVLAPRVELAQAVQFHRQLIQGPTEYRLIHPQRPTRNLWLNPRGEDDLEDLLRYNRAGYGVYAVINQVANEVALRCQEGRGARDEDVLAVRAVFVDLDGAPFPSDLHLQPSAVVESSPGRSHIYWKTTGLEPADFRAIQLELAEAFNSDRAVANPARVMRVPGFLHTKAAPKLAQLISWTAATYSAPDIFAAFAKNRSHPQGSASPQPQTGRPLLLRSKDQLTRYVWEAVRREHESVSQAKQGNRNNTLFIAAANLGSLVGARVLDEADASDALLDACSICGLEEAESLTTIRSGLERGKSNPREIRGHR